MSGPVSGRPRASLGLIGIGVRWMSCSILDGRHHPTTNTPTPVPCGRTDPVLPEGVPESRTIPRLSPTKLMAHRGIRPADPSATLQYVPGHSIRQPLSMDHRVSEPQKRTSREADPRRSCLKPSVTRCVVPVLYGCVSRLTRETEEMVGLTTRGDSGRETRSTPRIVSCSLVFVSPSSSPLELPRSPRSPVTGGLSSQPITHRPEPAPGAGGLPVRVHKIQLRRIR